MVELRHVEKGYHKTPAQVADEETRMKMWHRWGPSEADIRRLQGVLQSAMEESFEEVVKQ
jgi:hypothetical protein